MIALCLSVMGTVGMSARPASAQVEPGAHREQWSASAGAEAGAMVAPGLAPRYGAFAAAELPVSRRLVLRLEPAVMFVSESNEVSRYQVPGEPLGTVKEERTVLAVFGRAFAGLVFTPWLTGYAGVFAGGARGKIASSSTDSPTCGGGTLWRPVFGAALGAGARLAKRHGLELGALFELGKGYPFARCAVIRTDDGEDLLPDPPFEADGLFVLSALARVGYSW
ncbi:MAG: hypothetical protein HYZ29_24895 [Myxococcales bacterium]|nr:hypothetical protein [Myxococcales bacterium]